MYEIQLNYCTPPYTNLPYPDKVKKEYETKTEAMFAMLECLIDSVQSLSCPEASRFLGTSETNFFVPKRNYFFDVVWINHNVADEYNQKLRDKYGENLTLWIRSVEDDDSTTKYYYEGATCGESDWYDDVEKCFEAADDCMNNIELYVGY